MMASICRPRAVLILIGLAAFGALGGAQPPQPPLYVPDRPIAIVGGLLIDATGGPPRHDQAVVVNGNRIVAVGPREQVDVPAGAEVIDATGMTVMPGLINSNQHINLNPLYPSPAANLPLSSLKARWEHTWDGQRRRAFVYLMQGVTSMRNTSGPASQLVRVKQAIDRGEIPGPRLFLGAALFMSDEHFADYIRRQRTPADAVDWLRDEFAYRVVTDVDGDTDDYLGEEFNYWKLLMSSEPWNGQNDFTDAELRAFIDRAHRHGKIVDVHAGSGNAGLRRMLQFDFETLEHPFHRRELIDMDIIEGYVKKGVIIDTLLIQMISVALRSADPHRFDETIYAMSLEPAEYRVLLNYRDRMLASLRNPEQPSGAIYDALNPPDFPGLSLELPEGSTVETGSGPSPADLQRQIRTAKENMRRFIKAGAKFSMGTDTGAFLNFQQEDPNAAEMMLMVEMGMTPMQAIQAATRNGAEALGLLNDLGTIEPGKLADVIVVAGNPLEDMAAMTRVSMVVKDGVRYK